MNRMILPILMALTPLVACTKSSNKEEEATAEKVVAQYEAAFEKAKEQYLDTYVVDAGTTFSRGLRELDLYIDPENDGIVDPEKAQEKVRGKTLETWREEKLREYRYLVEDNWDVVDEVIREEYEVISSVRDVFNWVEMRDLGQRALDLHKNYRPLFKQRRQNQYYFDCKGDERLCGYAFKAVNEKMGVGNATRSYTGNRKDYRGVVKANIVAAQTMQYKRKGMVVADLPMEVVIQLDVKTKDVTSPYDGTHDFHVSVDAPSYVPSYDLLQEVTREQYPKVGKEIEKAIGGWEIPGNIY